MCGLGRLLRGAERKIGWKECGEFTGVDDESNGSNKIGNDGRGRQPTYRPSLRILLKHIREMKTTPGCLGALLEKHKIMKEV